MPEILSTFTDVTAELDRRRFISLGFERIEALLAALGNPERNLRVVQVVGTNGKGTTSVALSAAFEVAGETTGTYLSPHVLSYTERVRLRGEQVSEEAFTDGMGRVISVADKLGIGVTQFELLTAGALVMFRDAGVTWAVMEAGLGARYDATTVAGPEAVVLTNVAMDHTQYLGDTIEEIAAEKLASVPEGGALILGTEDPVVVGLARSRCEAVPARLLRAKSYLQKNEIGIENLPRHVLCNVRLGCAAAEILLERPPFPKEEFVRVAEAVSGSLSGRFEVVRFEGTDIVLDGGHNVAGLEATLQAVRESHSSERIGVVFGVLRDKNIEGMLELLREVASPLVLTHPNDERAAEPQSVFDAFEAGGYPGRVVVEPEISKALRLAVDETKSGGGEVVLVTGSFTTVAGAKRYLSGLTETEGS
ncbi:MAG: bifunctional folylpolyglutamate synthase/dihydrofolate synthase [Rubrobacter sp.]